MRDQPPLAACLPVGALVGAFQVTGVLRQGILGTVYSARGQGRSEEIALEILNDPHPDPIRLARSQREAMAAGEVGHPAILAPSEQGLLPDGRAYSVLDLLVGESLQVRLDRRGSLPLAEAAPWLDAVMEALAAAHAAGLVHRNLSPANIFLQGGPHGQIHVRVLDFGMSELLTGQALLGPQITRDGHVMGSPPYMAPEQASTSYGGVGPWTDVYALGAIAFHSLSGHPPYQAPTAGETLLAHLQAPVPSLREQRPGLPLALDAVLHQALAKRPEERFATMDAFRRAFRGSLRGSVVLSVAPGIDGPVHPSGPHIPASSSSGTAGTRTAHQSDLGTDRTLPPSEAFGTERTLPPTAALGTERTLPSTVGFGADHGASPYQGLGGAPGPHGAPVGSPPTLDPSSRVAWAATLRPEAFEKPPAPLITADPPLPASPWHKDRDSLEQAPVELEARVLGDLGPKPSKATEPELRRRQAQASAPASAQAPAPALSPAPALTTAPGPTPTPTPTLNRAPTPIPMPELPPLPAPGSGRTWLWVLLGLTALGVLGALVWYLVGR